VLTAPHVHIWVRIPLTHPAKGDQAAAAPPAEEGAEAAADQDDEPSSGCGAWGSWNRLRCLCEHAPSLGVALQLTADLPDDSEEIGRWCGEPVRAVLLPASIFLTNRQGYPTLSRRHQAALQRLMPHRPRLVVSGRPDAHGEGLGAHIQYLRFLVTKLSTLTLMEKFEVPYYDLLQVRGVKLGRSDPHPQRSRAASCRRRGGKQWQLPSPPPSLYKPVEREPTAAWRLPFARLPALALC
jgi:protein arginine N-methyltransferase 5